MTLQGKLELLEEILEVDEGTLKVEDRLEDIISGILCKKGNE